LKNIFYLIILAIFSLLANQYIANKGAFPIDSFLIYDAAYNIISGSHPFRDYWLITGPFLDYVQALFFLIFGVNWTSYVLHGSVINALLAVFSFYFFLNIGIKNYYAFLYSLGISLLAYPSIGSPFIDHHAVIFCVMAFYSISLGILSNKKIFWLLTPLFITFSFFSKQIPSPYFVFLFTIIILICFYYLKNINKNVLVNLLIGSFISLALVIFIFIINKIPVSNFLTQYIYYPFSLGDNRIDKLEINFNNLIGQFKFIYLILIPLIISSFLLVKIKKKSLLQKKELVLSLTFLISIGILIYCQLLTKNQVLIFFLIPICAAYSHAYAKKYFSKTYLVYFILAIFIFTTAKYHLRFNVDRKFIEISNANFTLFENAAKIDKSLSGLKWITPHYLSSPAKEIDLLIDTKNILLKTEEKKIIITDYKFLSSLINSKYASPNKWYDDLSIPQKNSKYYDKHKNFFLDKVKKNKIKYLYFVGENKHEMAFFKEFIIENKCTISNQLNELLLEFDISRCKF